MKTEVIVLLDRNEFNFVEKLEADKLYTTLNNMNYQINIEYINTYFAKDICSKIDISAEVFAFDLTDKNISDVFSTIKKIKEIKPDSIVCLFDAIAVYNRKSIMKENDEVDFIILGEPADIISRLIDQLNGGRTKEDILSHLEYTYSKYYGEDTKYQVRNFDNYIYPNRDNLAQRNIIIAHIEASYGCPSNCVFCTMPQINNKCAYRDIDDVFDEIMNIYKTNKIRFFHFIDSTIEGGGEFGKKRLERLCNKLISYPIKFGFRGFVRAASFNKDEDIKYLKLLRDAGFLNIFVGIESGSDYDLQVYKKNTTVKDNHHFFKMCKEVGLTPFYGFVMIQPFSNMQSIKDNLTFLIENKSDQLSHYTNCLQVYGNTEIYKQLLDKELMYRNYDYKGTPFQYYCENKEIDSFKKFFEEYIYTDDELQTLNSSYHNFIFLYNYMKAIGIENDKINSTYQEMSKELADYYKAYFSKLIFEENMEWAKENMNLLKSKVKITYSQIASMREKLLKLYLKKTMFND